MRLLYSILFYISLPFIFLRLLWRARRNINYLKRWSERLGYVPDCIPPNSLWFHCVSVGEFLAAWPLIQELINTHKNQAFLITTMTVTGSSQVQKKIEPLKNIYHCYVPYDLPALWERFLKRTTPRALIIMETEIWPNMLAACYRKNIPRVLINARLSQKSFAQYYYFKKPLKNILNYFTVIAVQFNSDAERFLHLGVLPEKIKMMGSIKFDINIPDRIFSEARVIKEKIGVARPVWIAASTREGEEEIIIKNFVEIRQCLKNKNILLILAPRHPERIKAVINICKKYGLNFMCRSEKTLPDSTISVFIIDTIGELALFYAVSDIAFVGGSLVDTGGHNILEPAALSLPIVTGFSCYNFENISDLLVKSGGLIKVDKNQLSKIIINLFNHPDKIKTMGEAAFNAVKENQGALEKLVKLINGVINI